MSEDKRKNDIDEEQDDGTTKESRRDFLKKMGVAAAVTTVAPAATAATAKAATIAEHLQTHFEMMSDSQKEAAIARLEKRYSEQFEKQVTVANTPAPDEVLFGYALNISKCIGCRRCVEACVRENNQSRGSDEYPNSAIQWIRVLRMERGNDTFELENWHKGSPSSSRIGDYGVQSGGHADKAVGISGDAEHYYYPEQVPEENAFYFPVQCQQCEDPACVRACPVKATFRDPNGIVVIDYNWCIGCRMCQLACPYWARRFNWSEPVLPNEDMNPKTHYLGNRPRMRGVMEKCTFCLQRVRDGRYPACVEACPVGARKFGNLLDPESGRCRRFGLRGLQHGCHNMGATFTITHRCH